MSEQLQARPGCVESLQLADSVEPLTKLIVVEPVRSGERI
jgi:hypothetical protein